MQYLLIILLNVFMWALFYLVISLKLEKSASHFREKKFREEMDRLMTEFNSTADRNISLLENRITTLKKLLQRSGNLGSIDIKLGTEEKRGVETTDTGEKNVGFPHAEETGKRDGRPSGEGPILGNSMEKKKTAAFHLLSRKFSHLMDRLKNFIPEKQEVKEDMGEDQADILPGTSGTEKRGSMLDLVLEKESYSRLISREVDADEDEDVGFSGKEKADLPDREEISGMFARSDDTFSVISRLYGMGCSIETISECSGMPAGEVKLILNLRGPSD